MTMSDSHRQVEKKYPSLPFENEAGLSTFDLNLIHRNRNRYVPAFKRREQIPYPNEVRELLEG